MAVSDMQLIRCPSCGATNRVPAEKIRQGLEPICGRCKTPLAASSNQAFSDKAFPNKPMAVTDGTFAAEVERSPLPVLLDLWAPWCGPCHMIAPVIEDLAREMAGRVRIAKLNIDENPVTTERMQVRGIPALIVMKGGREVDRLVGVQPKAEIVRRLERAIA